MVINNPLLILTNNSQEILGNPWYGNNRPFTNSSLEILVNPSYGYKQPLTNNSQEILVNPWYGYKQPLTNNSKEILGFPLRNSQIFQEFSATFGRKRDRCEPQAKGKKIPIRAIPRVYKYFKDNARIISRLEYDLPALIEIDK